MFYEALVHSGDNNCYKPTFLRVADKYLGLSIRLDNVDVSDFDKSYSNEKVNELFSYAFNMIKELEEHEITLFDKAKGYGEYIVKGYKKATLLKAVFTLSLALLGLNG